MYVNIEDTKEHVAPLLRTLSYVHLPEYCLRTGLFIRYRLSDLHMMPYFLVV